MISEKLMEPQPFNAEDHIFDIAFHPKNNVIACGLITGDTKLIQYSLDKTEEIAHLVHHQKSVRCCQFSPSGNFLATGSEDRSIGIIDGEGNEALKLKRAHENPIYSLYFLDDTLLASGDDEG
mmetsp:Transcript_15112/g.12827  ORF Transcript_15112/g.12827 Transcript_15112/m.12827 type:complete len:123 (+) Transcript_15112:68-436(+)